MREGINQEWQDALAARGIRTAILGWFDFASEPIAVWTGWAAIQPMGSGDALLDGVTFEPLANGLPVAIGDNNFSYSGSDQLELSLAVPSTPPDELIYAMMDPEEYQGRTGIIWRALMVQQPTSTIPAEWAFRRIRAGSMDSLSIVDDGQQRLFKLSIEAHQSMITNASGSTYLDQSKFDPADTSQAYAVSIANNPSTPSAGSAGVSGSGGGLSGAMAIINTAPWNNIKGLFG